MQIHLQADVEAKTDWTNDSSEMKRSGIEVGTANLYILYRRTWLRGSTSGTGITM